MNECNYPTDVCDRFWGKVIIPANYINDCWIWTHGAKDKDGYGVFNVETTWIVKSHRFAYQYYKGPIKPNTVVMHSCDTPECCNPYHLSNGTHYQNIQDCIKKKRRYTDGFVREEVEHRFSIPGEFTRGSNNGSAKLTENQVRQIRILLKYHNWTYKMIMQQFNIKSPTCVASIKFYRTWKHVII